MHTPFHTRERARTYRSSVRTVRPIDADEIEEMLLENSQSRVSPYHLSTTERILKTYTCPTLSLPPCRPFVIRSLPHLLLRGPLYYVLYDRLT